MRFLQIGEEGRKKKITCTEDRDTRAQREGGGHYCTIHTPTDHYTPPHPYAASHTRLISATKSEATRHALKFRERQGKREKKKLTPTEDIDGHAQREGGGIYCNTHTHTRTTTHHLHPMRQHAHVTHRAVKYSCVFKNAYVLFFLDCTPE